MYVMADRYTPLAISKEKSASTKYKTMRVLGVTVSRGLAGVADNIAAYFEAVAAAKSFDDGVPSSGVWLELL